MDFGKIPAGADFDANPLSPEQAAQGFAEGLSALSGGMIQAPRGAPMHAAPQPPEPYIPAVDDVIQPESLSGDPMGQYGIDALRQMAGYAYGDGPAPQIQQQQLPPQVPPPQFPQFQQMNPVQPGAGVSFQQPNQPPAAPPQQVDLAAILKSQQDQFMAAMQQQQQQQQMMMQQLMAHQQQTAYDPLYEQKLMEAEGVNMQSVDAILGWRRDRQTQAMMQQMQNQMYEMQQQQAAMVAAQEAERQAMQMTTRARTELEKQFKGRPIPPETVDAIGRHAAQLSYTMGPDQAMKQALQGYIPILNAQVPAQLPQQPQAPVMHPGLQQIQQLPGFQGLGMSPAQLSQQYAAMQAAAIQGGGGGRLHSMQKPMDIDTFENILAGA